MIPIDMRKVTIKDSHYTYNGYMSKKELLRTAEKHKIGAWMVVINNFVLLGWDEIDEIWEMSK